MSTVYTIVNELNQVISKFGCAQNEPIPTGYTEMDETDLRFIEFKTKINQDFPLINFWPTKPE